MKLTAILTGGLLAGLATTALAVDQSSPSASPTPEKKPAVKPSGAKPSASKPAAAVKASPTSPSVDNQSPSPSASVHSASNKSPLEWGIKGRFDVPMTHSEAKVGDAEAKTQSSSSIEFRRAEVKVAGERGADKIEVVFLPITEELDKFAISRKINDMFTVMVGKLPFLAQSWENDYEVIDQYLTGLTYDSAPKSTNGAQVTYSHGEHIISAQLMQGIVSMDDGNGKTITFEKKGGLQSAFQYRGEFNKMVRPLVTYTMVRTASANGSDGVNYGNGYQNQLGLGVQVESGKITCDAEYDWVRSPKKMDNPAGTNKDQDDTSLIVQAKLKHDATVPFAKISYNNRKTGNTAGDISGFQIGFGAEHHLDEVIRLHGFYAYQKLTLKPDKDTTAKASSHEFNFGVTAAL